MERVRRHSCMCEAERLEVSWRLQQGHFISRRTINYVQPHTSLYEFVALVQRLHGQLGRSVGHLLSCSLGDERDSPQLT